MDTNSYIKLLDAAAGNYQRLQGILAIEYRDQWPNQLDVFTSPETATLPTSMGAIVTLLDGMVMSLKPTNIEAVLTYVRRFPIDWQLYFMRSVSRKDPGLLAHTPAASAWFRDNAAYLARA